MRHLTGFAPLAAEFDGFVIDLWGVIHDGVTPYAGAIDCLERLRGLGKPTVLLSNAPRRSAVAQAAMREIGIADTLYSGILTSGEATHAALRERPDAWWAALGDRVYHLGSPRDRSVMEGIGLHVVDDPAEASFALVTGPDDDRDPTHIGLYEPTLQACRRHALPMVCANPDLEVIRGGRRIICAGAMAEHYAALGGDVRSIGKPDPAIYPTVFEMLAVLPDRIIAVGDALRTDIAGAAAAGIAACWVLGGIHGDSLGEDPAQPDLAARNAGLSPLACIPAFTW